MVFDSEYNARKQYDKKTCREEILIIIVLYRLKNKMFILITLLRVSKNLLSSQFVTVL